MTESDWLNATDPQEMLLFLQNSGKVSYRKLRLFAVACCRRIWSHLKDERSRHFVEVAESHADGAATEPQLHAAFERAASAQEAIHYEGGDAVDQSAAEAVLGLRQELQMAQVFEGIDEAVGEFRAGKAWERIYQTPGKDYRTQEAEHIAECDAGAAAERTVQSDFLREIFGNHFTTKPDLSEGVLAWNDGTMPKLAEAAYEDRTLPSGHLDLDRLAVLADALEEVGANSALIEHLRGPGPHVRGCSVIDLLTGRE